MIFPFRTSAIFRNRWIALLWAAGICFTAVEIADSVAGITDKTTPSPDGATQGDHDASKEGPVPRAVAIGPDQILK